MIYADWNASTPCLPEAATAVHEALMKSAGGQLGNPGSRHHLPGRMAATIVDQARESVAMLVGGTADGITFTSGATEACNLAIHGVLFRRQDRPRVCAIAVEHPAVMEPLHRLAAAGSIDLVRLPVTADGAVDLEQATAAIIPGTALVCAMLVNNETGVIHDVAALATMIHAAGGLLFCDATQAPARIPVDLPTLGVDLAALSAHKLGGPGGCGALWRRRGLALEPLFSGGGQERGLRPGTPAVALLNGFAIAAGLARERLAERRIHLELLGSRLERTVREALPEVHIHGRTRAPGVAMITHPGLRSGWLAQLSDIAASGGSSCSSGHPSVALQAMGVTPAEAANALRISVGWSTTLEEVDRIAASIIRGAERLRR